MKRIFFKFYWILVIFSIVFADQLSKSFIVAHLPLEHEATVISGFFRIFHVRNKGAGLGMLSNARWVFMSATVLVIIVVSFLLVRGFFKSHLAVLSLAFILGGGIGNMIDRVFLGYVVDFFQFHIQFFDFIFNVADIFITFGTIMFLIYYLFFHDRYKKISGTGKTEVIPDDGQV